MTEEQIKQNAEAYASYFYPRNSTIWQDHYNAYITGAYSRDEEIVGYQSQINMMADTLQQCMDELNKLRNPWISVKERLPEKIENKGVSKNVFVTWSDGTRGEAYYNYKEYKAPRWEIKGVGIMKPAYWMPIPELKKGE